jgi:thiazole synthase
MTDSPLAIAGRAYASRLIIGTGKYKSYAENAAALEASGAEIVTVAVRRVNLSDPSRERLTGALASGEKGALL